MRQTQVAVRQCLHAAKVKELLSSMKFNFNALFFKLKIGQNRDLALRNVLTPSSASKEIMTHI